MWDTYIERKQQELPLKDIFELFKKVDLNAFQEGIQNIQKTISLIQNIGLSILQAKNLYKYRAFTTYTYSDGIFCL